jgi:hypothetical protein
VVALQQALRGLADRAYIVVGFEGFVPRNPKKPAKAASLELVSHLQDWFSFDRADPQWTLSKGLYHVANSFERFLSSSGPNPY